MDARFMQMHNFVLTREIIINSTFPVDRMRELNFHRETAVISLSIFIGPLLFWFVLFVLNHSQHSDLDSFSHGS